MHSKLPPGPWDSKGNKVTVNGQTVAVVFYPRDASEIARRIAELPDILEELEEMKSQIESTEKGFCDEFGD